MNQTKNVLFTAVMEKHRTVIERYVHYRMPTSMDAEDVLQETWLAAYTHFDQLSHPSSAKGWLLAIARNQCALWYRQKYRRTERETQSGCPAVGTSTSLPDELLAGLPGDTARILQLYYVQGYLQREIAVHMGIPLGTVKSRLHYAKEHLRRASGIHYAEKKGNEDMKTTAEQEYTKGFPSELPPLIIEKLDEPYTPIRFWEESFIIPRIGEVNSEGTYRYPAKKLTLVSTCRVPKAACIHEAEGVKVVRDTYNVRAGKLYRNESVWFTQMTEEYIRELGCLANLEEDDEYPTYITTFLDDGYNSIVNAEDPVKGVPILVQENPVREDASGILMEEAKYNIRCTLGMYRLTIGERTFRAAGILRVFRQSCCASISYVSPEGRLLLLRWYETEDSIRNSDNYPEHWIRTIDENETLHINRVRYIHTEDRIGEIVL